MKSVSRWKARCWAGGQVSHGLTTFKQCDAAQPNWFWGLIVQPSHNLRVWLLLHQCRENICIQNNHSSMSIGLMAWPRSSGRGSSNPTPAKRAAMREPSPDRAGATSLTALRKIWCTSSSILRPCWIARTLRRISSSASMLWMITCAMIYLQNWIMTCLILRYLLAEMKESTEGWVLSAECWVLREDSWQSAVCKCWVLFLSAEFWEL